MIRMAMKNRKKGRRNRPSLCFLLFSWFSSSFLLELCCCCCCCFFFCGWALALDFPPFFGCVFGFHPDFLALESNDTLCNTTHIPFYSCISILLLFSFLLSIIFNCNFSHHDFLNLTSSSITFLFLFHYFSCHLPLSFCEYLPIIIFYTIYPSSMELWVVTG